MNKLFLCLLAAGALYTGSAIACNTCGCPAGNPYMGLLPQTNNSFAGLKYSYRGFSSIHPDDGGADLPGTSYEYYNTVQLWGRYAVSKRLQVYAIVPYVSNSRRQDGTESSTATGPGDVTALISYRAVTTEKAGWKHNLIVGAGAKAPTGAYDHDAFTDEEGLPNMQPGTHAWDVIAHVNYTLQKKKTGLNADVSYTYAMPNHDSYKFGNRTSAGLLGFYQLEKGKLAILPQVGVRFDHATKDYENFSAAEIDEDSGGWQLFASQGVQAYYKHFGAHVTCYEPLAQYFASGLVTTRVKAEAGIMVLF